MPMHNMKSYRARANPFHHFSMYMMLFITCNQKHRQRIDRIDRIASAFDTNKQTTKTHLVASRLGTHASDIVHA
jgi:hypothetical protein